VERVSVRPTLDIHGIQGGFTGPGKKTVIPARATAKVSMRLVPDQEPAEIARLFEAHVRAIAPPTVTVTVEALGLSRPALLDFKQPAIQAGVRAYELGLGVSPLYARAGGTLPIVADFQEMIGAPVVMMGFGRPDDNIHAPNEKLNIPDFYRGVETIIHFLHELAR
jgi:acetylornithine deacetylase/succinyl-diaminopimelate desuccinylase-like protein